MNRFAAIALLVALPVAALAIVEPKTRTEYPDTVTMDVGGVPVTLVATGVGLREKTFMKVDVYTIVSYVAEGTDLGDAPYRVLRAADVPKRIQMDLRRGFSREKLVNSFREVIEKNYADVSPFEADMNTLLGYFQRDAQDKDRIVFSYAPGVGLTTELNGEVMGLIDNPAMVEALWTVWFGEKPADKGLRAELSGA
ncbi:MAG: chalcone isomerase family protein [Candidatus Krumholzibacteriia bacterium]